MRKGFHINSNFRAEIDIKIRDRGGGIVQIIAGEVEQKEK